LSQGMTHVADCPLPSGSHGSDRTLHPEPHTWHAARRTTELHKHYRQSIVDER
jgi:hypothetical protein